MNAILQAGDPVLDAKSDAERARSIICDRVAALASNFDSSLRAILITGSTARGEHTGIRESSGNYRLLSDVEGFFVFTDASFPHQFQPVIRLVQQLQQELRSSGLHCRLDINAISERFLRTSRPNIFTYELAEHGDVIWGDREIRSLIPHFPAATIPLEDAWRLLANRIVEQLETLPLPHEEDERLSRAAHYRTIKLVLATANSLLVFKGRYSPSYRELAKSLEALGKDDTDRDLPFELRGFSSLVSQCTDWKLGAGSSECSSTQKFWAQAVEYARDLWEWELARLTTSPAGTDRSVLYSRWLKMQRFTSRIRGWLYVLRHQGWLKSWKNWYRWVGLALQAAPRYWVYRCASEHLFSRMDSQGSRGDSASAVASWLPIRGVLSCDTDADPVACNILWNYREFLERTRA